MNGYRRVLLSMLLINWVSAFVIFFYFAYIDLETLNANKAFWRGTELDWTVFAVIMILLGVISALVAWWRYNRPLQVWEARLQANETSDNIPDKILRWAATYPLNVALISFISWVATGLFFARGGLGMASNSATFWRTFIGIAIIGGFTSSTLLFFTVDSIWERHLPCFFPAGGVSKLNVFRISVGQRLIATLLLTGVVPLLVLGTAARNSILKLTTFNLNPLEVLNGLQVTILFVVFIGIISNILLSILTARSLLKPLQLLISTMENVGDGNLNVRLPVKSNDELGDLSEHFNRMLIQLHQSQQMRELFGRYVSKEVAEQALKNGADLGGESVSATALFADIRNFTGLSESLPAEQVVDILNRYYTRMVDAIVDSGGMVNKFGGDSLLAIFGVPIRQVDHALRAVRAAWQMNRTLAEFNAEQIALGMPPLTIGIGISSGKMVAGNIGGSARMEYTVIGDPVNLASRLESLTKEWGRPILLSEHTEKLLGKKVANLKVCERIAVRGKQELTLIYELQGLEG